MNGRNGETWVLSWCATFQEIQGIGSKVFVFRFVRRYLCGMHLMRHLLTCLVIATVLAVGTNDVASAANGLEHQTHCVDAFDDKAEYSKADHADGHHHDDLTNPHTTPGHDHETCMMHACPALSVKAVKFGEVADIMLAKLSWPEHSMHLFERADGLKRPPKS